MAESRQARTPTIKTETTKDSTQCVGMAQCLAEAE